MKKLVLFILISCAAPALHATTWFVNGGGGTRYSANNLSGQCNGSSAAAYPGSGVNQSCAFKDIRSLWSDGSYTTNPNAGAPVWGWIGAGGDTYIIDCTGGALCRIGQNGPLSGDYYGLAGDPYHAFAPVPPSGTAGAHTKIQGVNAGSCTSAAAKAHINGGYGVATVLEFAGASYVDVSCLDITDFSSCGRAGQANGCNTSLGTLSDYATNGIHTSRTTTNVTFTDLNIHGISSAGMSGATGDGVTVTRVAVTGNASSGWNMDDGGGTTGTGNLHMTQFATIFNGCSEVYPIASTISIDGYTLNGGTVGQVADCTDDNHGGYGDGIGTATTVSSPAWLMTIDKSIAAYNTQDGFDLLHLTGGGSSLTITNSYAHSNMGQQIKVGAAGTAYNNVIVGNCNALRQSIPGTPAGYNSNLSDFCRAADVANVMSVNDGATTRWLFNTTYTANAVALEVPVNGTCSTSSCVLQYENNILIGFTSNTTNGYPSGGSGNNPAPIYFDTTDPMGNPGSVYAYNATYHQKASTPCPDTGNGEAHYICTDPQLTDETWHLYGMGNMAPASGAVVIGAGLTVAGITTDIAGTTRPNPPTIGAYEGTGGTPTAAIPTTSLPAGTYVGAQTTTLATTTAGGVICYTTDGTAPTATVAGTCSHGTSISGSGSVSIPATLTIQALTTAVGYLNSATASYAYGIVVPAVITSGTFTLSGTVKIQ